MEELEDSKIRYIRNDIMQKRINENKLFIKTRKSRVVISGNGISSVVGDIISYFSKAKSLEQGINLFSRRFDRGAIGDLMEYLVMKEVLISQETRDTLAHYNSDIVNSYGHYVESEKDLPTMFKELKETTVGIICISQFANCLINHLRNNRLFKEMFFLVIDNGRVEIGNEGDDIKMAFLTENTDDEVRAIIDKSDIVITSCNYENSFLFDIINRYCLEKRKNWIRVVTMDESVEIGPLFIPGSTCCYTCLNQRLNSNLIGKSNIEYLKMQIGDDCYYNSKLGTNSSRFMIAMTVDILIHEVLKFIARSKCDIQGSVLTFYYEGYKMRQDRIFKYSNCNDCCGVE